MLQRVLGDQTFSLKDVDFSKIDQIEDVIKLAIEFERDTVVFYEMIESFIRLRQNTLQLAAGMNGRANAPKLE